MSEGNKLILRRFFEEGLSRGNLDLIDELFAADYVGHGPFQEIHGPEGTKESIAAFRRAFPDLQYTIEDQVAEGATVVTRWTARGTHMGEFQGLPPGGRQWTVTGMALVRIADGKIVEGWTNADSLGMLRQLGAIPAGERPG